MPFKSRAAQTRHASATSTDTPMTFTDGLPLPKLLVFDLDYTLWPFWCDTHLSPPVRPFPTDHHAHGLKVKDAFGGSYGFYSEVPSVLRACKEKKILLGVASRTYTPDIAGDLLDMLLVNGTDTPASADAKPSTRTKARSFFNNLQIYPGNKATHMKKLSKQLDVRYEDMLFFDDEERNRNVERELGVCFWLVRDGVTRAEIDRGVEKWRKARGVKSSGVAQDPKKVAEASDVDVVLDRGSDEGSDYSE